MAKQSILDIIINLKKQGGADKETIKELVQIKSSIGSAVTAFAALAGVAYTVDKALDATVGTYTRYGERVREASLALGLSAEETSRVIALTDDLGISYEDLSASIKKNADNTDYSIEGLARASEEYLKLGDAQDRAKFAQEKYGKQWGEFSKLLEKGPGQVRAMAAAVDQGHIFDEADLARIENYRIATDQLNDSWEAIKMTLGEAVIPPLTDYLNAINDSNAAMDIAREKGATYHTAGTLMYQAAIQQAKAEREKATEIVNSGNAAKTAADDMAGYLSSNKDLLDTMQKLNGATREQIKIQGYQELKKKMTDSGGELKDAEAKILEQAGVALGIFDQNAVNAAKSIDILTASLADGKITLDGFVKSLNAIPTDITVNVAANTSVNTGTGGYTTPQAIGGQQEPGNIYQVHQDEIIVAAQNGYTLTRSDAQKILEQAAGNQSGGGKSVNIYGNITVVAQGSVMGVLEELG